jgi:hypothetical protein
MSSRALQIPKTLLTSPACPVYFRLHHCKRLFHLAGQSALQRCNILRMFIAFWALMPFLRCSQTRSKRGPSLQSSFAVLTFITYPGHSDAHGWANAAEPRTGRRRPTSLHPSCILAGFTRHEHAYHGRRTMETFGLQVQHLSSPPACCKHPVKPIFHF